MGQPASVNRARIGARPVHVLSVSRSRNKGLIGILGAARIARKGFIELEQALGHDVGGIAALKGILPIHVQDVEVRLRAPQVDAGMRVRFRYRGV